MIRIVILIAVVGVVGLRSCDNPGTVHTSTQRKTVYQDRHPKVQQAHDMLIDIDLNNKQWELEILREIYTAQENEDVEAFKFFMSEYIRVPRLKLTEDQKTHPNYREWLSDDDIKSGRFMSVSYDFVTEIKLWSVE